MPGKYNLRYLDKSEYDDWDLFVDECEDGTIFNKSFWLENLYKTSKNITFKILGCFDKDSKLIAGFAFGYKKKFSLFSIIVLPSLSPYSGILIKERKTNYISKSENYKLNLSSLIIDFLNKNYSQVSIILSPSFKDIRSFSWDKFSEKIMYTYYADLTNPDNLVELFDPDVKRQIKKLENTETIVKKDDSVKTFFDLQKKSFERQQHSFKLNEPQFINFLEKIHLAKCYKVYTIYDNNQAVYSTIILFYKETAYYWLAGGDPNYFTKGYNKMLLKEIIFDLNQQGIKHFDFIGANTPNISKYKSNFGFNLTPYYYIEKINSNFLRLLLSIKSIIK